MRAPVGGILLFSMVLFPLSNIINDVLYLFCAGERSPEMSLDYTVYCTPCGRVI